MSQLLCLRSFRICISHPHLYLVLMAPIVSASLPLFHVNGKWGLICHLLGAMSGSEQGCSSWQCVFDCCHDSSSCEKRRLTGREKQKSVKYQEEYIHCLYVSVLFSWVDFLGWTLVKMRNHSSLENSAFYWRWSLLKICLKSFYEILCIYAPKTKINE